MKDAGEALVQATATQVRVELATRDWTQKDLAEKVGITRETLGRYLKGQRDMPMPTFYAIAEAFGYSPRELMSLVQDRISPEDRWF